MDFFAQQDRARKNTSLMVVLFLASVVCIVLSINIVGGIIYLQVAEVPLFPVGRALASVPHSAYWITTAIVLGIIAYGTISRLISLSGGGAAVAELVGARRVDRNSSDAAERRLLNIVEEMAIAAGITVPLVYVMDDQPDLNAFAAGYSPNEAAITVTRGILDTLNRDELQGVIAHEFSHILNGDMRLNVRIMGVIAGIVMIGALGRFVMRMGSGSDSGSSSSSSSSDRNRGDSRIFLAGLVIWLIGSIGVLFGSLIKAAISRQREYLADASAVQFTRNPDGIGSALYQIQQHGSQVHQRHADELSHMYFSAAVSDLFATHPPLEQRIERVMGPGATHLLRARNKRVQAADGAASPATDTGAVTSEFNSLLPATATPESAMATMADSATPLSQPTSASLMASVGTLSMAQVEHARRFIDELPPEARKAVAVESGAKASLFALLLGEGDVLEKQLALITAEAGAPMASDSAALARALQPLGVRARLPIFELAVPTLRFLQQPERDALLGLITALINADGKVTLAEFVLLTLCRRHFEKPAKGVPPVKHQTMQSAAPEAIIILTVLAKSGVVSAASLGRVLDSLGLTANATPQPDALTLKSVEAALYELKLLAPLKKPAFIKACLEIVMADGKITPTEGELMRAICAALDTPLPPIIETST